MWCFNLVAVLFFMLVLMKDFFLPKKNKMTEVRNEVASSSGLSNFLFIDPSLVIVHSWDTFGNKASDSLARPANKFFEPCKEISKSKQTTYR